MIKEALPLSTLTQPFSTLGPLSKKWYEEVLTAHNISILLLIRAYIKEKEDDSAIHTISRRLGFCKLIQYLLQSPDFSFSQFVSVITESKYNLGQVILNRFHNNISKVVNSDVDILLNFITESERFIIDPLGGIYNAISIHRLCPVGVFFRKMIVFLDKLTFSQTVKVYRLYQQYYLMSKGAIQEDTFAPIAPFHSSSLTNDEKKSFSVNFSQTNDSDVMMQDSSDMNDMEISVTTQSPFTNPIVSLFDVNPVPDANEKFAECLSWSHRQTELFLAEQAMFLEFDENSALPPLELHRILNRIIVINPDYSESYFVSYLNCLRVKEFNGALENLFQFFDNVSYQDKAKGYRYAALNLAILNVKFGNGSGAISALKECIMLSHESNDNICLHIAQAWLRCLNEDKKIELIESTVLKCDELELHQIASLSLQMCAQNFLKTGYDGNVIFNLLDKSDAINSQRMLPDLTITSISHRVAVWCSYGQYNIAFLISQILLNIDTTYAIYGLTTYNTEGVCTCICNIAGFLSNVGKYQVAKMVLTHAKNRFPHEYSSWWKMCEQILYFEYSLHLNLWNDAYKAACQIATVDKKESLLRLAELSLEKGDRTEAASRIDEIFTKINENELTPHYLLRAYLIGARAKTGGASLFMLRKALTYAIRYGYPRFKALIKLEIAKLQLELGYVKQATQLVEKSSVIIFSENKLCEQATALTLLAKCNVALVQHLSSSSLQKINTFKSAISKLDTAKSLYQKLECMSKVKDVAYLQVVLANEIGWYEARNTFALEFRRIDTEQNHTSSCSADFCNSL